MEKAWSVIKTATTPLIECIMGYPIQHKIKRHILFKAKILTKFDRILAKYCTMADHTCNLDKILLTITTTEDIMYAFN